MKPAAFSRTWSEEEDAVLASAVVAGRPLEDVAAELGRSVNAVQLRKQRTVAPRPRPDGSVNHGWSPGLGRIEKYWTPAITAMNSMARFTRASVHPTRVV